MSAGDLPARAAGGPRPVPSPPGPAGGQRATGDPGDGADGRAGTDDVLADLEALPADAPVLQQAEVLEDLQERLAQRLSGAAR
ncbi:hypothetical protein WDZ17_14545 [Pseudokineococcus basanitobsidens]|uniref:Uncharacterized protein n=1 Tax=Pseudokineococcus basanitobsidens TaxID=1926649 RepID=A0ABU8RNB6_9ACTN